MQRFLLLILICAILLPSAASAGKGERKGFIFGGGVGFAPWVEWKFDRNDSDERANMIVTKDDGSGMYWTIMIGYGFSDRNMLVTEIDFALYDKTIESLPMNVDQGYSGVTWYHYFGRQGSSVFGAMGFGLYRFENDLIDAMETGVGIKFGLGWEFIRHFQAGVYYTSGATAIKFPSFDDGYKHGTLSLVLTGVVFGA